MNKKTLSLMGIFLMGGLLFAQQNPTNNNPSGTASGSGSNQYWSRAGNNDNQGSNNIFGTLWNSPIYTQTNAINRMKLNGNITYSVNNYSQTRNGYLLIGPDMPMSYGGPNELYSNYGAFSQLHLNGNKGADVQQFGFRPCTV
jgi:hypothetical protein